MRAEIIPLTSLRGAAAMAVIALHFSVTMQSISSAQLSLFGTARELAVDVFFVLSEIHNGIHLSWRF